MNFLSLFTGFGGLDLGLERAGMTCVAQVEIHPYALKVAEKHWPKLPRFKDVKTVTKKGLPDGIELIAGGFPCTDISRAGNMAGIDIGEKSGLWREFYRLICEIRPRFALVENVAALLDGGIGRVLGDLAEIGYDAEWEIISACAFGYSHPRERVFIIAYPASSDAEQLAEQSENEGQSNRQGVWRGLQYELTGRPRREAEPSIPRVDDGFSDYLEHFRGYGNAVHVDVAEWIGRRIMETQSHPPVIG